MDLIQILKLKKDDIIYDLKNDRLIVVLYTRYEQIADFEFTLYLGIKKNEQDGSIYEINIINLTKYDFYIGVL